MDIATVAAGFTAIKQSIEIAKFIRQADNALEQADYKVKLADLLVGLSDAKIAMSEMQTALHEKDQEIKDLKSRIENKKNMTRFRDVYYVIDENGKPVGTPYCPRCFEKDGIAIGIVYGKIRTHTFCPQCKNEFGHYGEISPGGS